MAIPFMAYNMAIGKTPTGGDWAVDRCMKCDAPRDGRPEAAICVHEYGDGNVHPLEPTPYASGGFWPVSSNYYNEMYSEEEDYEPVYDHSMEIETMRANERMGAALAYCYLKYPNLKQEVVEFLDDYPFTF